MVVVNQYLTLSKASVEGVYKEKGSKFIGYAFPVNTKEDIDLRLAEIKRAHGKARHCCYAWKLGVHKPGHRMQDDGEPSNSAGRPIYGQILSYELTNVLVIVVRYFGGTKLGVGGLIQAYKSAAKEVLMKAAIIRKEVLVTYLLESDYQHIDKVMRVIKSSNIKVIKETSGLHSQLELTMPLADEPELVKKFKHLRLIRFKKLD